MKETKKNFDKTEDDLKALQSMGQIIGEVLRQLDDEKCASLLDRNPQIVASKTSRRMRSSDRRILRARRPSPSLTVRTPTSLPRRFSERSHREGVLRPAVRGGRAHEA